MTEQEVINTIKEQSIQLPSAGVDRWPGHMMNLDTEQIAIDGKPVDMDLFAWYDLDEGGKQPSAVNCFIISYKYTYIILDWFHEAKAVWEYLKKSYPIPD